MLFCFQEAAPLEPVGSRSPRHKWLVGRFGGKKVHWTFFLIPPHPIFRVKRDGLQRKQLAHIG